MRTRHRVNLPRQLQSSVASFAFARRRAEAIHLAVWGVAIGGLLAGLVGATADFYRVDGGIAIAGSLAIVAVLAATFVGWTRQTPDVRVALEIDRRLNLGERVTTALEIATIHPDHPLAQRQIADAVAHLASVRPGLVYPLRLSRRLLALAAAGVVLAAVPWAISVPGVPGIRTPASHVAEVARSEATRLDGVANTLQSQKNASDQSTRAELAAQLRRAADELRNDAGQSQEATQDLARAEQAAAALSPRTGEDAALTLARISDALNNTPATKPVTQALDQQNTAQAAAALNQLAANLANMSPQQRADLAKALQAASNAARGSDTSASEQLQQAAQAAQNGDAQGMQQAAQALQQLDSANQAQRDAAQTQSELQSSQQAIAQAAQTGLPQLSTPDASASSQSSSGGQSSDQSGGQSGSSNQAGQGSQNGNQQGGGIGKGSANHLGSPNDFQNLAQREVTVPTNQQFDAGSIGASNQLQIGTGGQAQVDYRQVLPEYQKQALQAIEGNAVPSGMKQVVKGYFDSLAAR